MCNGVGGGGDSLLAASAAQQIETDGKATSCGAALHGSPTKLQMTFRDLDGYLGLLADLSR